MHVVQDEGKQGVWFLWREVCSGKRGRANSEASTLSVVSERSKTPRPLKDRRVFGIVKVLFLPRARMRSKGLCDRSWCLYINYISALFLEPIFYLPKYSLSEVYFNTDRLLIESNGLWYSLAARQVFVAIANPDWVKDCQRQKRNHCTSSKPHPYDSRYRTKMVYSTTGLGTS